jgi:hypothetical protein
LVDGEGGFDLGGADALLQVFEDSYNNKLRNYLIDEAVCGSML